MIAILTAVLDDVTAVWLFSVAIVAGIAAIAIICRA